MIAALLSPSVRAGRTIASTLPWPTAGRSRRCRANTSSSMMPNQKLGIETANSDAAMVPLSRADPGRTAARVPRATPIGMASPSPTSASRTVYGKDSPISVATCRLPLNERPRSPCTAFHRKRPNWTGRGRSSPSSRRMLSYVSWDAPTILAPDPPVSDIISRTGSPGRKWSIEKTISDTPSSTGTAARSRRAT